MIMKCENCEIEIPDSWAYCNDCRNRLYKQRRRREREEWAAYKKQVTKEVSDIMDEAQQDHMEKLLSLERYMPSYRQFRLAYRKRLLTLITDE